MLLDSLGWDWGKGIAKMICLCFTMGRASPRDNSRGWGLQSLGGFFTHASGAWADPGGLKQGVLSGLGDQVDRSTEGGLIENWNHRGVWPWWWVDYEEMVWGSSEGWPLCLYTAWASSQHAGFRVVGLFTEQLMALRANALQSGSWMTFYEPPSQVT